MEEKNDEKERKKFFPIIFFVVLLLFFLAGYYVIHPIVDKPSPDVITLAERSAIEKERSGNITGAIEEYNNLLNKEKDEEKRCIFYVRIGKLYSLLGKTEIARNYYEKAINLSQNKNFTICNYEVMFWKGYYEKNLTCLEKSAEIAEILNNDKKKFYSYSQIANYYLNTDELVKAKEFYDKAKELSNNGDERTIGYNFLGIGTLYEQWGEYENALENLKQAEIYLKKIDDKEGLLNTYMTIAYIYSKQNDTKNAMDYYKKAEKISNVSSKGIAYLYVMLASKKLEEKKYNEAIENARSALNLYAEYGTKQDIANIQNILCYAYFASGKQFEADECYKMLNIESLDNDENKFKSYKSRASLNEFFGLKFKGVEKTIIVDENGKFKEIDTSCKRILDAIDDYRKAYETGKRINVSSEELKEIENKILELENKTKECV